MKDIKEKSMNLEELARMMQAGFQGIDERLGKKIDKLDLRMDNMEVKMDNMEVKMGSMETRMSRLEERSFTNEEKEAVLAMVRHYDKRLEAETLGKDYILLTRKEYNIFVKIAGIPNRFEKTESEYV